MNFYESNYKKLESFLRNEINPTTKELNHWLRDLLGHELCELIQNPDQPISLTDVKTDLSYLINFIKENDILSFKRDEKVLFEKKVYDFGYIGKEGHAIIYEEGERNMQDAIAVPFKKLRRAE